jgi:hypothetical protein
MPTGLNTSQWLDASGTDTVHAMPKLVAAVRLAIERLATPDPAIAVTPAARTPARESYSHSGGDRLRQRATIVAGSLVVVAIAGFAAYRHAAELDVRRPPDTFADFRA